MRPLVGSLFRPGGGAEGMFAVEVYATVRQLVFNEGKSRREVARLLGLSRDTVGKMCRFSAPPGYVRSKPVARPKLGPLIGVIDAILEHDRTAPPGGVVTPSTKPMRPSSRKPVNDGQRLSRQSMAFATSGMMSTCCLYWLDDFMRHPWDNGIECRAGRTWLSAVRATVNRLKVRMLRLPSGRPARVP